LFLVFILGPQGSKSLLDTKLLFRILITSFKGDEQTQLLIMQRNLLFMQINCPACSSSTIVQGFAIFTLDNAEQGKRLSYSYCEEF